MKQKRKIRKRKHTIATRRKKAFIEPDESVPFYNNRSFRAPKWGRPNFSTKNRFSMGKR
jgi:hypothetical protein